MTTDQIVELQYDVMTALGDLQTLQPLVARLMDTHQRGLGFLTPAARKQLDAAVAADRHALRTQPERDTVGLDWLNRDRDVIPTGHVRTPGNVSALSVEADIYFTARHLVKRTTRWLYRVDGVCVVGDVDNNTNPPRLEVLPSEPTIEQLLARLRTLVVLVRNEQPLHQIWRDIRRVTGDATFLVDGDDKTLMGDPCPHCGNKTLVVHWRQDLIRCDRDQHTGHYQFCRCVDPLCECRNKPIAFRHEWHGTDAAAGDRRRTWRALSNLLTTTRAANNQQGAPA